MTLREGGNAAVAMIALTPCFLQLLRLAVIKIKGLMRQQITLLGSSPPTCCGELRAAQSPLSALRGVFGETESVDVYLRKEAIQISSHLIALSCREK